MRLELAQTPVAHINYHLVVATPDWENPSMCPAPPFQHKIFISLKPYLWVQWERPLELCLRRHIGSHQRADSAPQFLPPPPRLTADPWFRSRFLVGRSFGSLCQTRTAGQSLDQLPGNSGGPGCYWIQDRNSVIYIYSPFSLHTLRIFLWKNLQCGKIVLKSANLPEYVI